MLASGVCHRARAPLRLSFGGGGSELPPYVHAHGGVVLNATIGRYVYATLSAAEDGQVTFTAADCGLSETLPPQAHYATDDAPLPLHRAVYNRIVRAHCGGNPLPLTLHTYSDAPVGSGLGTSSTLTVAMLRCFDDALNLNLDEYALAALAHDVERRELGLSGGYQDHYAAAFGGVNFMEFRADGEVVVNPLRIRRSTLAELEYAIVLYFTGVSRASAGIIDAQTAGIAGDDAVMQSVHRIKALAHEMKDHLLTGDIRAFAAALNASWQEKRATASGISTADIDALYARALDNGALGGKISGAGGGGFMMFITDPRRRREVIDCLPNAENQVSFCHFTQDAAAAWRVPA